LEEVLRDDEVEHGVAEELETLVRLAARHLGAVGAVRECVAEQLRVAEVRSEARGERVDAAGPLPVAGRAGLLGQAAPSFAVT
jgi:hypothetical protein